MPDTSGTWTVMQSSTWNQMQQMFSIYQISAILLIFIIITIMVLFKDAFPFMWARFVTHEIVVGVLDKTTRRIVPNSHFKKVNGMFYYDGEPQPFIKVYGGNFMFAGLPFDIVDVDLNVLKDPRYIKACTELRKKGYPNIDALERAILFSQMTDKEDDLRIKDWMSREGFESYADMKKRINPAGITVDHDMVKQFFTTIQLSEMIGYGTEVPSEDILGEVDDVYEARKPSMKFQRDMSRVRPAVILIIAIGAIVIIVYKVFFAS